MKIFGIFFISGEMDSDRDSDRDSESLFQDSDTMNPPSNTQANDKSNLTYAWVILFQMDVDSEFPFSISRLSQFKNSNFPWELIKSDLNEKSRLATRNFDNMDGPFCVFAKIEHGKNVICMHAYTNATMRTFLVSFKIREIIH